jgi:hypothetical protein
MAQSYHFTVDDSQARTVFSLLPGAIRDEVEISINNIVQRVRDTINTDYKRSGGLYPSYLNPSASGKGFTDRTGRLRQSIQAWSEVESNKTVGYVSAGVDYDKYVELLWGGQYSYMFPALMQNQDYILDEITNAITKAINRFI